MISRYPISTRIKLPYAYEWNKKIFEKMKVNAITRGIIHLYLQKFPFRALEMYSINFHFDHYMENILFEKLLSSPI